MASTPRQNTLAMEVMARVTWESRYFIVVLKCFHANNALFVGIEKVRIVLTLIHCQCV